MRSIWDVRCRVADNEIRVPRLRPRGLGNSHVKRKVKRED